MAPRRNSRASGGFLVLIAGLIAFLVPGQAADLAEVARPAIEPFGVPCEIVEHPWSPPATTAATLPWPSVWLGHFSGGRPYADGFGRTLIDWRDEKVCFVSRTHCQAWIRSLRRTHHDPEGYWTCVVLR